MNGSTRVLGAFVLAMTASAPSCAPSTFANLTGGESEELGIAPHSGQTAVDPTLAAPRPISPLSVSWVNTSRPRLRWELPKGQSGAIVELSQTRQFKQVKHLVGTGEELVVPEDLDAGFWFWRLKGRTEESEGVATSPVWEVLVRGPGRHGASDVPSGGINDYDGDGEPELNLVGVETNPEQEEFPVFMTLLGQPGGRFAFTRQSVLSMPIYEPAMALSGALDINGDGFSDFVATLRVPSEVDPESLGFDMLWVFHGGSGPGDSSLDESPQGVTVVVPFTVLPRLEIVGDVDGDGYGDVVASFEETTLLSFGSTYSLRTMTPLVSHAPSHPIPPFTGVDLDGDGRSDIVRGALASSEPGVVVRVTSGPSGFASAPAASNDLSAKPATAFAYGDFDGDGEPEVACATTIDGLPAVCVYSAKASAMTPRSCWISDKPLPGFGESLVAADIDEDGKDEILVPSSAEILVLRHEGIGFVGNDTSFSATSIEGSFVPRLALIHPGRPGKARWAVYGADRQSLHIFFGTTISQTFEVKDDPYLSRFGEDIR